MRKQAAREYGLRIKGLHKMHLSFPISNARFIELEELIRTSCYSLVLRTLIFLILISNIVTVTNTFKSSFDGLVFFGNC